jgi:hypothetical protein
MATYASGGEEKRKGCSKQVQTKARDFVKRTDNKQVAHEPLEPPSGSRTVRKRVAPPPKYDVNGLLEPLACYFCAQSESHWVAPMARATCLIIST